jgi:hypothetical protein
MDVTALINEFHLYRTSHPNLSDFWMAYLELKKEHCGETLAKQAEEALAAIRNGQADLQMRDIISLLMYKEVMLK